MVDTLMYLIHEGVEDKEARDEYLFLIRKLDNEYLKIVREQHVAENKRKQQQASGGNRVKTPGRR